MSTGAHRVRFWGFFAVGVLLAGCGGSPNKAQQAEQQLRSWDATVALLERVQASGALPERYAAQVHRAAVEGRAQAEAQLRKARAP